MMSREAVETYFYVLSSHSSERIEEHRDESQVVVAAEFWTINLPTQLRNTTACARALFVMRNYTGERFT